MKTIKILPLFITLTSGFFFTAFAQSNIREYSFEKKEILLREAKKYTRLNDYNVYTLDLERQLYFYFKSNCNDIMTVYFPVSVTPVIKSISSNGTESILWTGGPVNLIGQKVIKIQVDENKFKEPNAFLTFSYVCNAYHPINFKNDIYQIYSGKYYIKKVSASTTKLKWDYATANALRVSAPK